MKMRKYLDFDGETKKKRTHFANVLQPFEKTVTNRQNAFFHSIILLYYAFFDNNCLYLRLSNTILCLRAVAARATFYRA